MFNIILPKSCEIFAKSLANFKWKFDPQQINQYNSGNAGRMIYLRENSTVALMLTLGSNGSLVCVARILSKRDYLVGKMEEVLDSKSDLPGMNYENLQTVGIHSYMRK